MSCSAFCLVAEALSLSRAEGGAVGVALTALLLSRAEVGRGSGATGAPLVPAGSTPEEEEDAEDVEPREKKGNFTPPDFF